jgi:protein-S-isoprenylcysteine O-methyltransferase Ste14
MEINKKRLTKSGIRAILALFRWMTIQFVVLFISAGRMDMPRAWFYVGLYLVGTIINAVILWKVIPELANERGKMSPAAKTWDKIFVGAYFPLVLLIVPAVIGLDTGRFFWSGPSIQSIHFAVLGIFLYIIGTFFALWAMIVNKHFDGMVRIQDDRDHRVCTSGPYKIVRHPGYVGMILGGFFFPLMLGSLWGLVPVGAAALLVVIRTSLEDKMLQNELNGYAEYAKDAKYRLFPGLW